jgi:hypothetical protein
VFDKSARDGGTFSRGDFDYNQETDIYICPAGKVLASTGTLVNDGATLLYRASKYDCDACELKPRCCPKMPARKVPRSIYENARDVARDIAKTETYVTSRRERKKIEMLFAHLKRILRLDRLRLRGPSGAQDEFLLAATVQNLRKMAKLIPLPAPMPARQQTSLRAPDALQHPNQLGRRLLQHNPPKEAVRSAALSTHSRLSTIEVPVHFRSPGVMVPVRASAEPQPVPRRPCRAAASRRARTQGREAAAAPLPRRECASPQSARWQEAG